jgi:hypothetical protein
VFGYANNSIDGDSTTYWSDDGLRLGSNQDSPPAASEPSCTANLKCPGQYAYTYPFCAQYPFWLRVRLAAATSIQTVQLAISQDMTYDVQTSNSASGPWVTQATRTCTICTQGQWTVVNSVQTHVFTAPVTTQFIQIAVRYSGAAGPGACGGCLCAGTPNAACTSPDFCSWCDTARASRGALPRSALNCAITCADRPASLQGH